MAAPLLLGGCALFRRRRPVPPLASARFVVGAPYQTGGLWRYPRAEFDYDETGLAVPLEHHGPLCADGAPCDPAALVAAHRTLQLPCVVRVTNLESGLSLAVRVDDRGPESPGRLIALSPRAMALLGPGSTPGVLRVRVQTEEAPSRALADALAGGSAPALAISAAPSGAVQAEALAPPPGVASSSGRATPALTPAPRSVASAAPPAPLRLPEAVTQGPSRPGALFVELGGFSQVRYARLLAGRTAELGARVDTAYAAPRDRAYRVRIGPLATVPEADAALDRALRAGVVDARIVVDEG